MGYSIDLADSSFRIKKDNVKPALVAVRAMCNAVDRMGGGSSDGRKWFSFADMDEIKNGKTLVEAVGGFRWLLQLDENGDVAEIEFEGEKIGDDEFLFQTLAPFVEDGCFLEIRGEDGAHWRWVFDKGQLVTKEAKVSWE
jgi:hypothetical protein